MSNQQLLNTSNPSLQQFDIYANSVTCNTLNLPNTSLGYITTTLDTVGGAAIATMDVRGVNAPSLAFDIHYFKVGNVVTINIPQFKIKTYAAGGPVTLLQTVTALPAICRPAYLKGCPIHFYNGGAPPGTVGPGVLQVLQSGNIAISIDLYGVGGTAIVPTSALFSDLSFTYEVAV